MKQSYLYSPLFFSLIVLLSIVSCGEEPEQKRPNVIFILADDLGYGDLACYGHPYAKTPNIDKLAEEGTSFNKFYASGLTCCPSRTALMTAKHPLKYPVLPNISGFGNHVSITELFSHAGYSTGHVGKWHIGPMEEINDHPYGIDFINITKSDSLAKSRDESTFDAAVSFIEQNNDRPFYLNIWTHISHFPVHPSEEMLASFEDLEVNESKFGRWFNEEKTQILNENGKNINEAMQAYLADVYSLDLQVGRLMEVLKAQNMDENTIVIFSSDQGPDAVVKKNTKMASNEAFDNKRKDWRLNMVGYSGGLRGGKHSFFEGGIRVPFIIKWPKHIPENHIDDQSVLSSLDFLPSLCSIVGIDIETDNFDGLDKSKTWLGKAEDRKEPLFWKIQSNKAPVSILMDNWKMHEARQRKGVTLYDLENDPFEENDVSSEHQDIVEDLLEKIDDWNSSLPRQERRY